MQSLEFEGKTIDQAIENACLKWQVSRDKLNIEIISEGTSGFLGIMGKKQARIRATLLSLEESLKVPMSFPSLDFSLSDAATVTKQDGPVAKSHTAKTKPAAPNKKAAAARAKPQAPVSKPPAVHPQGEGTHENPALRAQMVLSGILTRMNLDCPVTIEETEDRIILNINGNGSGLLIGRRGQNLDALQYIVNKAVHKSPQGRKMIVVDTESYRRRREESLTALAAKIGEKVKKTKKAVTLNYLNAQNRRIIHMALQNDLGITTKSRGEGEYRKLIIVPMNKDQQV